jgi:hypothetical protein
MKRILVAAALTALLAPPLAWARARVYVRVAPPAPIVEVRAVAPSPRHVWVAGYHRWNGAAYVWVPGRWELPPAESRAWVAGHWAHHASNGWYWVEGHWRR